MMSLEGKKVLVTEAAGFVGSHLTERLADLNLSESDPISLDTELA